MRDRRNGKTYYVDWDHWIILCYQHREDPWNTMELGFDLGGGDSYTVKLDGEPPKEN